ncbi:MAG: hypothetical protein ACR2J3_00450 [Aridibacter sp.]
MTIIIRFLVVVIILAGSQIVKSQNLLSENELESLLDKAEIQAQNYTEVFQNLSADELKTKFYYKENGKLDDKRIIKSIFIVYQSPDSKFAQEYRNVVEYNGKNVQRDEKEIAKFFDKLSKIDSTKKEYEKIRKEGLRYDGRTVSWGMTLRKSRPFSKNLRKDFDFRVVAKEKIDGVDVWRIEYEQIRNSPYIYSNPTKEELEERKKLQTGGTQYGANISDDFRPTNPLMKGTVWLDVETAQIRRNDFQIVFHPAKLSKPITVSEFSYQYQSSDFGILVPKRFSIISYKIDGKSDKDLSVTKDSEIIYDYSNFKEFKTDIDNYKIK